jgi:hypothetical protein
MLADQLKQVFALPAARKTVQCPVLLGVHSRVLPSMLNIFNGLYCSILADVAPRVPSLAR